MTIYGIEESVYHQMILEQGMHKGHKEGRAIGRAEGREEGHLAEARNLAMLIGRQQMGSEPPAAVRDEIMGCEDRARVERMVVALARGQSWTVVLDV